MSDNTLMKLRFLMSAFLTGDEAGWDEEFDFLWTEHQGQMDELTKSIQADGIHTPISLGRDGRVWDGHHRIAVAHRLGIEFVPIEFVGDLNKEEPDD